MARYLLAKMRKSSKLSLTLVQAGPGYRDINATVVKIVGSTFAEIRIRTVKSIYQTLKMSTTAKEKFKAQLFLIR